MASTVTMQDRALVVFTLHTSSKTSTVHLVGSWDNFSSPLLMTRDTQTSQNVWKFCLGSSKSKTGTQSQGLRMGARYTYYFVLDGLLPTIDCTAKEKQVDVRTGIVCSVLYVPVEVRHSVLVEASTPDLLAKISEDISDESYNTVTSTHGLGLGIGCDTSLNTTSRPRLRPSALTLVKRSYSLTRRRDAKAAAQISSPTSCDLYSQHELDKPALSPTRLDAPARPKIVIPTTSVSSLSHGSNCNTPSSSVPSLTPSSGLNSAVTPNLSYSPYTPSSRTAQIYTPITSSAEKEKRRLGFHIKTPSMPSLSGILGGNRGRSHMPIISNPIPIELHESLSSSHFESATQHVASVPAACFSVDEINSKVNQTRIEEPQELTSAYYEHSQSLQVPDLNSVPRYINTSPISRCTSIDSTSSSISPSLTQSEFSVASSPSLNRYSSSSISSSVMEPDFESDFELDDEVVEELYSNDLPSIRVSRSQRNSLKRVDQNDFADVEAWYRNAKASRSRSSNNSGVTRISDVSCITQFEDLQEVFPNLSVKTISQVARDNDRSASPMFFAPKPKRLDNGAIKNIESQITSF